jgi:ABC-type uncharacterized transport system substrate-binding protein
LTLDSVLPPSPHWIKSKNPNASAVKREAEMAAKVLRGANPGDLPVEQPSKFRLVVNLKTAKAINYEVPASLVLRADKVIE